MAAALFFDVDGTLIDSYHGNRRISKAVRAELARVQALGNLIFLSSGRSRLLLTPEILEPEFDGLVLINGGYVELGGKPLFEERMGAELARKTVSFLEDLGTEYVLVCATKTYTKRTNHGMRDFFNTPTHGEILSYDYDLDELLPQVIKFETLTPVEEHARVAQQARDALGPDITCDGHGGEGTLELYPTAISKAKGIRLILKELGIGTRDAYAFGDGTNDLEMLRYCGCGVAMANAEDAVKAEADIVCPAVWDDGLAQVLQHLF